MRIDAIFPEIGTIADETLRTNVSKAWTLAAEENDVDVAELDSVPWFPPGQAALGIAHEAETLVGHVRDVTACAIGLTESISERRSEPDLDVDTVVAGALVHDVSKLYEFDGMDRTEVGDLLGHPYFGVAVTARANLPVELSHIVLSHTHRTAVEPATMEAEIVRRADEVAAAAIRAPAVGDLRDV